MNSNGGVCSAVIGLSLLLLVNCGCEKAGSRHAELEEQIGAPPETPSAHGPSSSARGDDRKETAYRAAADEASHAQSAALGLLPSEAETAREIASLRVWPLGDYEIAHSCHETALGMVRSYPSWKIYEDEFISFAYPDDAGISVSVLDEEGSFNVSGGVASSCENTWFRCYLLMKDNETYCAMLLERAGAFDDGICFCGEVVFHKCRFINGALYRFSFLKTGQIKKVQVLCNKLRVVVFEWTHLPIHQDVYLRIALSLRMKNAPCGEDTLRQSVLKTYGLRGKLSFLELGMDKAAMLDLLGKPHRDDGDVLWYRAQEERLEITCRLNLTAGQFRGLEKRWCTFRDLPPERGTAAWIREKAMGGRSSDYDLGPLTNEDVDYLFDRFCEIAPGPRAGDWNDLCRGMVALAEKGYRDSRVLAVVRKHLLNAELDQDDAAAFLHSYDPEGSKDLLVKLVEQKMEYAAKADSDDWGWGGAVAEGGFEIGDLLRFIGPEHKGYRRLVLAGMKHPHEVIRSDAYDEWDDLSEEEALPLLRKGLRDSSDMVRWEAARAFAEHTGNKADVELLKECLSQEQDQSIRKYLSAAIERLSKTAGEK